MGPMQAIDGMFRPHTWVVIERPNGSSFTLSYPENSVGLTATSLEEAMTEAEAWMLTNKSSVKILTQWLVSPGVARTLFVM